jgi:predicted deacetylase
MIFQGFNLHATPTLHEAYCTNKKCKEKPELVEVSNGFVSRAWFCTECYNVYVLNLVREEKVSKEFLQQCLDEVGRDQVRRESVRDYNNAIKARNKADRDKRLNKAKKYAKKNK